MHCVKIDLGYLALGPIQVDRLDMLRFVELEPRPLKILHKLACVIARRQRQGPAKDFLAAEEVPEMLERGSYQ